MKWIFSLLTIFMSLAASAQRVNYPKYGSNGMPVRQSKSELTSNPKKGAILSISSSGVPVVKGSYEVKDNSVLIFKRDHSLIKAPKRKLSIGEKGNIEVMYYTKNGLLLHRPPKPDKKK